MKELKINILYSIKYILMVSPIIFTLIIISCEEPGYDIEYQNGRPNILAGNWAAFDYQLEKSNHLLALDTINDFNLQSLTDFNSFVNLLNLTAVSDEYNLVTALDPADTSGLFINNIYDQGIRARTTHKQGKFDIRMGEQLNFLNQGGLNISFVSLSGQLVKDTEGDILFIVVGLYDYEKALLESLLITAYRKTGFEDTKYKSLLNK
ncbi:MAG: hypothetical protein R6W78_12920 [Bacteroidales bacterium]